VRGIFFFVLSLLALQSVAVAKLPDRNNPKAVISYLRDTYDADSWDRALNVWWPEGVIFQDTDGKPPLERRPFRDVPMSGLGVQYRTSVRFLSIQTSGNRSVVITFEKSKRLYLGSSGDYEYVGMYQLSKVRYICEKRAGQWRVLSIEGLSSRDFGSDIEWRRRENAKRKRR
jgi:hypothetical protein